MQQQLKIQVALWPGGERWDALGFWGCLRLPKAEKCLQPQPRAPGTSQAGQGRGELESGPTVASLGQGLVAPQDLVLPPVWMCLTQTKHNIR